MDLSPQQTEALDSVSKWFKEKKSPLFYLAGFAGTGKTTLARYFAEGLPQPQVRFAAFTGKAAKVLRSKGCPGATTIHSLIYTPIGKSEQKLVELREKLRKLDPANVDEKTRIEKELREEKDRISRPNFGLNQDSDISGASLVILDECSMISAQMMEDLLSFQVPILVLGDTAQLPPVKGAGYFTDLQPDYCLTKIHRQAEGSPVLHLATLIREGDTGSIQYQKIDKETLLGFDQILVGKNENRRLVNEWFRNQKAGGYQANPFPIQDDKLVCLKNDHDLGLLNGMILTATTTAKRVFRDITLTVQETEEDKAWALEVLTEPFERYRNPNYVDHRSYWERRELAELDYAYALTVHKAQGSQWDNVLILDDGFGLNYGGGERRKWLYTAVTRAAKNVTIARFSKENFS